MKTFRKILAITLSIMMLFGSVAAGGKGLGEAFDAFTVKASAGGSIGTLTWGIDSKGLIFFSGTGSMGDSNYPWADCKDSIKMVSANAGLENIGNDAFKDCTNLTYVGLPYTVKTIGFGAFQGCTNLTEFRNAVGITTIGSKAFWGCSNLSTVVFPSSLTSLGLNAFYNCSALTDIYFYGTEEQWNSVSGKDNVGTRKVHWDYATGSIKENNVRDISWEVIDGVLTISGTGDIPDYTASGVNASPWFRSFHKEKIKEIVIGNGITAIGDYAFYNIPNLEKVTIPESVTAIGDKAFYGAPAVTDIYWNAAEVTEYGEYVFNGVGANNTDGVTLTFGDSVVTIPGFAFYYDEEDEDGAPINIADVIIGDGCEIIGGGAFNGLVSLESVDFGESVKVIGLGSFANCENLSSIDLPESVEEICYCAFDNTEFYNNTSNWENGVLYSGVCLIDTKDSVSANYTVKAGTTVIADSAFYNAENLTHIRIPSSVKAIGEDAFDNCGSITLSCCPGSAAEAYTEGKTDITCDASHLNPANWSYNDAEHWYICTDCGSEFLKNGHIDANHNGDCDVCLKTGVPFAHKYEGEWQKDADGHWQVCSCGDTNKTAHTYVLKSNAEQHWQECSACGYTKEEAAHTPKAAVKENEKAATYTAPNTWDEVVYCEVCNYEISRTQKSGSKLTCDVMPDAFYAQRFAHNADVTINLTINGVPAGAKVYIDGKEATASGSEYSAALGKIASKSATVQIKIGDEVIETSQVSIIVVSTHTYEGEWQKNPTEHWKVCVCGDTNKTAHTPKAAVKENEKAATYTAPNTWDEVVYCEVCNYEISRTPKEGSKLTCDVMPDAFTPQSIAHGTDANVKLTIDGVPADAKVYIDGKEASVSGKEYSAVLGKTTSRNAEVEIRIGAAVIERALLPITVDPTHTYEGEWQKDASGHWKVCACGDTNKTAHTPKAAVKENEKAATFFAPNTWDEVIYCEVCGYKISSTPKTGETLTCDVMGEDFGSNDAPYKTYPVISVTIDNVPAGTEVYIANKKAEVSGNTYKVTAGQINSDTTYNVEIRKDGRVIESATVTVNVDDGFFAKIASFFSNFLFNLFKWKEVPVTFGKSK